MSLASGTRLGPYEIVALIGVGGMGQVYRATDTNLGRTVAIKVLPAAVASNANQLARFDREAKVLAALNHPNIAAIYGVEKSAGTTALVMELVEGPTLADRITQGALAVDEALAIARQIAEALEAAHERAIIHRDIKPANLKVRPDGTVKVLDFGLSKVLDTGSDPIDISNSPTVTSATLTESGVIMGTAAYMSPEQARGTHVDRRADIWAFGCVLYEMLTGTRAYKGNSVVDVLAAVVHSEPAWDTLPISTPPRVRDLLRRCFDKEPRRRLRDIGEARIALEEAIEGPVDAGVATPHRSIPRWLAAGIGLALLAGTAVGTGIWVISRSDGRPVTRLSIVPPADAPLNGTELAVSPDGRRVVYVSGNGTQLSVRSIDELTPNHITNLGSPRQPFISPDGEWIGFFDGLNALRKVPISGGPALFVTSLGGAAPRGASWSPDGTIVFATDDPATGLWRVSENGGTAQLLTKADQGDHVWPYVLPGGAAILFTQFVYPVRSPEVAVLDPMTGERRALMPGSHALYVPTGHLVYSASGTLRAIGFDLSRRAVVGISRPVLDQVSTLMTAALGVVLASDGTLAYVSGASNAARELVWVDRDGKEEGLGAATAGYVMPRLSPDGRKVVLDERVVSGNGLWMWDIERKMMMPFTFGVDAYPLWTPDGERVVYTSFDPKTGVGNLTWQSASGAGGPERLIEGSRSRYATSFAPDGSRLVFREEADAGLDIGVLSLGATRGAELTIQTEHSELNPEISPDGRWLAYESNQSGSAEIYVRPFPDVDAGLWQVSAGGGVQPAWARNGRELFYRTVDGALMAVPVELKPRFVAGAPAKIFEGRYFSGGPYRAYDVSPDGKRFLVITRGAATGNTASAPGIVVVQNWTEELKRLVLTK